jgi:hypothetical protein
LPQQPRPFEQRPTAEATTAATSATTTQPPTTTAAATASNANVEQAELPAEASAAIDNAREAMNSYDFESMWEYLTEDFTFQSYGEVNDLGSYIAYLDRFYESENFNLEVVGKSSVIEGAETYIVAEPGLTTGKSIPDLRGFSMTTLVESDGAWLIQQIRWIGEPLS